MKTFEFVDGDGQTVVVDRYLPERAPRGVVQIAHGWAEHAGRYTRVADAFVAQGYAVYANDHRGHGRTALKNGGLGDFGPGGMEGVVLSVRDVTLRIEERAPIFLLGHSWGSSIARRYATHWGGDLAGLLLTGTTDPGRVGERGKFEGYRWLSRDEAEVQKYVDDPLCGFEIMAGRRPEPAPTTRPLPEGRDEDVPLTLPILVFNGADDPIGGEEGGRALAERYEKLGLLDVTFRAYPRARHELFNELNREEVVADVLGWLAART